MGRHSPLLSWESMRIATLAVPSDPMSVCRSLDRLPPPPALGLAFLGQHRHVDSLNECLIDEAHEMVAKYHGMFVRAFFRQVRVAGHNGVDQGAVLGDIGGAIAARLIGFQR